jgi:predicted amidophosphoribosyltransferase
VDVRVLAAALLDLVLPGDCAACGAPEPPWCARCRTELGPPVRPYLPGGPAVFAAGRYTGPLRSALLRYKERGRRDLAGPLGALLTALVDDVAGPAPLWLVPAPSRPAAARVRGGDHVARLCREVVASRPGTRLARPLRLSRGVRDSVGLDPEQRAANLAGRVRVRPGALPGDGAVLLVDDVVTTGATLRACRDALVAAGKQVVGAVVLCDASVPMIKTKA